MKKTLYLAFATLFLAIAIMYPTYAIFQSMIQETTITMNMLQDIPQEIKDFFKMGGWDIDTEAYWLIEASRSRNNFGMTFLITIEAICIVVFAVLMKKAIS